MADGNWLGLTDGKVVRVDDQLKTRAELRLGERPIVGLARLAGNEAIVVNAAGLLVVIAEKAGKLGIVRKAEVAGSSPSALRRCGDYILLQTSAANLALVDPKTLEAASSLEIDVLVSAIDCVDNTVWYASSQGHVRRLFVSDGEIATPHEAMVPVDDEVEQLIALTSDLVVVRTKKGAFAYNAKNRFEAPLFLAASAQLSGFDKTRVLLADAEGNIALHAVAAATHETLEGLLAGGMDAIIVDGERVLVAAATKLSSFRLEKRADAVTATRANAVKLGAAITAIA